MGDWGLRGSCGLSIGREHELLLILRSSRCPEQDLAILKDGIPMWLCWHVGHVLQQHLLVGLGWLSRNLTWPRQRFAILASHPSHAGVDDLSLWASSCHGDLSSHPRCHGVGQHEGWLRLLTRLPTHLKLAIAVDGVGGLACWGFCTSRGCCRGQHVRLPWLLRDSCEDDLLLPRLLHELMSRG